MDWPFDVYVTDQGTLHTTLAHKILGLPEDHFVFDPESAIEAAEARGFRWALIFLSIKDRTLVQLRLATVKLWLAMSSPSNNALHLLYETDSTPEDADLMLVDIKKLRIQERAGLFVPSTCTVEMPRFLHPIHPQVTSFWISNASYLSLRHFPFMAHLWRPTSTLVGTHRELMYFCPTDYALIMDDDYHPVLIKPFEELPEHHQVYYALNPYNGLEYGHGGMKLFNRKKFLARTQNIKDNMDMTLEATRDGLEVVPLVTGEHRFATSPFRGFCGAFREVFKLARKGDPISIARLTAWIDRERYKPEHKYMAEAGRLALTYSDFPINNRAALMQLFLDKGREHV